MPAVGVDLLGEDERQPRDTERVPQPGHGPRQRARQHDMTHEPPPAEPQRLPGFDEVGVDTTNPGVHIQVQRKGHTKGDDGDLRRLTDPEPDDEQRNQPDERHGPQHLHARVDEILANPEKTGQQRETGPDDDTAQQADGDTLQ